jgi:hypothetical protein
MAVFWVVAPCSLMMEAASTSETVVNFYQTTRCNNSKDRHLRTHRRDNLKSHGLECVVNNLIYLRAIKFGRRTGGSHTHSVPQYFLPRMLTSSRNVGSNTCFQNRDRIVENRQYFYLRTNFLCQFLCPRIYPSSFDYNHEITTF